MSHLGDNVLANLSKANSSRANTPDHGYIRQRTSLLLPLMQVCHVVSLAALNELQLSQMKHLLP